jgi:F420-0:gamma-glutamyl ligase
MKATPIKTRVVSIGDSLPSLLQTCLPNITSPSVIAISSKVVALCQKTVIPVGSTDRQKLFREEAEYYLSDESSLFNFTVTIKNNSLVAASGIDYAIGHYVLWPRRPQATANVIRSHLRKQVDFPVGVIITDSRSQPLKRGTVGFSLAHSGFSALKNYIGSPDVHGETIGFKISNLLEGLAATAVTVMGEGNERTPIVVIQDIPGIQFQDHNPTAAELAELNISLKDDLFAELFKHVPWDSRP